MKKILFADDEIEKDAWEYRELEAALDDKEFGEYEIEIAVDGYETDEKLRNGKFDGIILDIMMPSGNNPPKFLKDVPNYLVGLEIAMKLKKQGYEKNKDTKVVILTGTAVAEVLDGLEKIEKDGRFDLIKKPAYMAEVVDALK